MWLPWRLHLIPFYISERPLLAISIRRHIQISCKICRYWLFTCSSFKCSFHRNSISVKVVLWPKMFSPIVSLCVPNFRMVTRSAQFSRNLELCPRTNGIFFNLDSKVKSNDRRTLLEVRFSPRS